MVIYEFLFYKVKSAVKLLTDDSLDFISIMILCYLLIFNSVSFSGLIVLKNPELGIYVNKGLGAIIGILIISSHFLYFGLGNKSKRIERRFKSIKKPIDIFGTILVIAYVVFTNWFCLVYMVPKLNETF